MWRWCGVFPIDLWAGKLQDLPPTKVVTAIKNVFYHQPLHYLIVFGPEIPWIAAKQTRALLPQR